MMNVFIFCVIFCRKLLSTWCLQACMPRILGLCLWYAINIIFCYFSFALLVLTTACITITFRPSPHFCMCSLWSCGLIFFFFIFFQWNLDTDSQQYLKLWLSCFCLTLCHCFYRTLRHFINKQVINYVAVLCQHLLLVYIRNLPLIRLYCTWNKKGLKGFLKLLPVGWLYCQKHYSCILLWLCSKKYCKTKQCKATRNPPLPSCGLGHLLATALLAFCSSATKTLIYAPAIPPATQVTASACVPHSIVHDV